MSTGARLVKQKASSRANIFPSPSQAKTSNWVSVSLSQLFAMAVSKHRPPNRFCKCSKDATSIPCRCVYITRKCDIRMYSEHLARGSVSTDRASCSSNSNSLTSCFSISLGAKNSKGPRQSIFASSKTPRKSQEEDSEFHETREINPQAKYDLLGVP